MLKKLCIVLVAVVAFACSQPSALPPVNINISNVNTNTTTTTVLFGSPVPSADPGCLAIARLRIESPATMKFKDQGSVSVTPIGTDGETRSKHCDETDGVRWSGGSPIVSIASPTAFVSPITANAVGTATVTVSVGKAEGSVEIKVVS